MSIKSKIKNFFTMDDEYEYIDEDEYKIAKMNTPAKQEKETSQKVVNLTAIEKTSSKVVLAEPRSYNEVQEIADNIINHRTVVINLQRVDHAQAKRIVDFLSGTIYALSGSMQKLGEKTFLCAPDNVDVSGTISELYLAEDETEKGWL